MAVFSGLLRQELIIEFEGESGEDAGGLRRQFFDKFTSELVSSPCWQQTAAGGLRPADTAARAGGGAAAGGAGASLVAEMETAGRVCGMALYQELHRRMGVEREPHIYENQPPNLFGDAFARYFIRVVQHNPPHRLDELQEELNAESLEADPDFRGGEAVLNDSVDVSGLSEMSFVRTVGEVEVALREGGAAEAVTDANKEEWLELLLRQELVGSLEEAAAHFRAFTRHGPLSFRLIKSARLIFQGSSSLVVNPCRERFCGCGWHARRGSGGP